MFSSHTSTHTSPAGAARSRSTNKLLASLPPDDFARLSLDLRTIPLGSHQVLQKQGASIEHIYFPGCGGTCSLIKMLNDGHSAEIATVGDEGLVGQCVFFEQHESIFDVVVQIPGGSADVMPVAVFNAEMSRRGALFNRVIRYTQGLLTQVMQTMVCNGVHSVEERFCRWLLMTHDRVKRDEFPLTHEFLAIMLGVRRPTVTLIAGTLQQAGLISHRRGHLRILDRQGLEAASCECYETVKTNFSRLLPEVDESSR